MKVDFALMSESFSVINDPRKAGMTTYSAQHLIFMTLCGLLSGCDTWVKIADHVSFRSHLFMNRFGLKTTPSHVVTPIRESALDNNTIKTRDNTRYLIAVSFGE